jgi:hypothetical protein
VPSLLRTHSLEQSMLPPTLWRRCALRYSVGRSQTPLTTSDASSASVKPANGPTMSWRRANDQVISPSHGSEAGAWFRSPEAV